MTVLLALAASVFTATASVAQRIAAAPAPGELTLSWRLILFLIRRPVWFLGILCMIAGFLFQLAALHFGELSLVQPVIATELLFVFAYLAFRNRRGVRLGDWAAAVGMAGGLGAFLFLADPSGGSTANATAWMWILAASSTFAAVGIFVALAMLPIHRGEMASGTRKAVLFSIAAGIAWGFVAAVIKELSVHIQQGAYAVFTNWSPYVLLLAGAAAMFLVTNAFQAGPLAASQPGLTIVDPLVASLLGVTLFNEHINHGTLHLTGEAVAASVLLASVVVLSRSPIIQTDEAAGARAGPAAAEGSPPRAYPGVSGVAADGPDPEVEETPDAPAGSGIDQPAP